MVDIRDLEKEAENRRKSSIYSGSYGNDIEKLNKSLQKDFTDEQYKKWAKQYEKFYEKLKERSINPKGKFVKNENYGMSVRNSSCCDNPDKYKNIISANLKFWSCRNCGADLGNI